MAADTAPARPTALVTGASGGIGLELARLFAKGGHDLILTARNEAKLRELAQYLGGMYHGRVEVIPADLTDPDVPEAIMGEAAARGLQVDVLVNNAGFGFRGPFSEMELQQVLDMVQVNVIALTQLTRLALPAMLSRKSGRILNLASTAAFAPGPLMAVYYATKAYVLSFSEALANEVRGSGVTVTALCPGPTKTGFADAARMGGSNLFEGPGVMDPVPVAEAGYRGLMRGAAVVVPGLQNKALIQSIRISPRFMVTAITRWFQERRS
jgi:hypothetical protein